MTGGGVPVRIRLRRTGKRKQAYFRFVAADSRSPRDGRFIEILGHYRSIEKPAKVEVKEDRVFYWLKKGAVPSETVSSLFKQIGLTKKWELLKKGEDVSGVQLATEIKERKKKKRLKKKAKEVEEKPLEKEAEKLGEDAKIKPEETK
jgi:small subunit ribosomal protein S16